MNKHGFKPCIINFEKWNKTMMAPINEECGLSKEYLILGNGIKLCWGLLRMNVDLSNE